MAERGWLSSVAGGRGPADGSSWSPLLQLGWAMPHEKNRQPAAVNRAPGPPGLPCPEPLSAAALCGRGPVAFSLWASGSYLPLTGLWLAPALPRPARPGLAGSWCSPQV